MAARACSFSTAAAKSAAFAFASSRRGYAAAAAPSYGAIRNMAASPKGSPSHTEASANCKTAWGPDPITGYYRPENLHAKEIDAAELRRIMVSKTMRQY